MRLALLLTALMIVPGCRDRAPARIVLDADPFLFNGPDPVAIPARVVSAGGETLGSPALIPRSDADSIIRTTDNSLQCLRAGDADVALSAGALRATLRVRCRPITSFGVPSVLDLFVGGPAQELPLRAFGPDNAPVEEMRFSARSSDTTVAIVRDGKVVPQAMGTTRITLDFGGIGTAVSAEVVEQVSLDTVRLAAGEYRSWSVPPGRYRMSAHAPDGRGAPTGVELRSSRANCARDPRDRETLHCVVAERGALVARAPRALTAVVRIVRRPR